jgi:DNA-binding transcriptional MerR regulator
VDSGIRQNTPRFGISAAARQIGCAENTLRKLELRDVLHPFRDSAGRRLYTDSDIVIARNYFARRRPWSGA